MKLYPELIKREKDFKSEEIAKQTAFQKLLLAAVRMTDDIERSCGLHDILLNRWGKKRNDIFVLDKTMRTLRVSKHCLKSQIIPNSPVLKERKNVDSSPNE